MISAYFGKGDRCMYYRCRLYPRQGVRVTPPLLFHNFRLVIQDFFSGAHGPLPEGHYWKLPVSKQFKHVIIVCVRCS